MVNLALSYLLRKNDAGGGARHAGTTSIFVVPAWKNLPVIQVRDMEVVSQVCNDHQEAFSKHVQAFVSFVAALAALSEIIAIWRRGKKDERQNIWTPLLLMLVKFGFLFITFCQALKLQDRDRFQKTMFVNFTYFSKVVAYVLWGVTFVMVMTVQIHCSLQCNEKDNDRIDLSLHSLCIVLVVPFVLMGLMYWRFHAGGGTQGARPPIHKSVACSSALMIAIGIVLGLSSSNYF